MEVAVDATPACGLAPGRIETMTAGTGTLHEDRVMRSDRRDVLADVFGTWEASDAHLPEVSAF